MTDTPALPDWLPGYLAERDQQRADDRAEAFGKLTDREQRLCREFAVMGFVQGNLGPPHEPFPKDSVIMIYVLDGMLSSAGVAMTYFRSIAEVD